MICFQLIFDMYGVFPLYDTRSFCTHLKELRLSCTLFHLDTSFFQNFRNRLDEKFQRSSYIIQQCYSVIGCNKKKKFHGTGNEEGKILKELKLSVLIK